MIKYIKKGRRLDSFKFVEINSARCLRIESALKKSRSKNRDDLITPSKPIKVKRTRRKFLNNSGLIGTL